MIGRSIGLVSLRFISVLFPNQEIDNGNNKHQVSKADHVQFDSDNATRKVNQRILGFILEVGAPGLTVCIAKQGKVIWRSAFGYCDVENLSACDDYSVMKIASISKAIFAASMVAPLVEQNKLNLKSSIHDYLTTDEFPKQKFDGQVYDITIENLLSHTSGIRHYNELDESDRSIKPIGSSGSRKIYQYDSQYNREDFFIRTTFRDVIDALKVFKDDLLAKKPGEYLYTTYGYTLLSAVVQKILQREPNSEKKQVEDAWIETLREDWKMKDTYLDQDEVIIPLRARHYRRDGVNKELINIPYMDPSSKWAGGGLVSNTTDLIKFANKIFDLYKRRESKLKVKRETIDKFWTPFINSQGLGFRISKDDNNEPVIYHTGCSVGSSSVLLMKPESEIAVAILTNIPNINLVPLSLYIAEQFRES